MFGLFNYRFPDIWDEMTRLNREMNRALGNAVESAGRSNAFPALNVYDDGESYLVRAEIPGVAPQSLEVQVAGNSLTIKGERPAEQGDEEQSIHRRERDHGRFARSLDLPQPLDPAKVRASYDNGVLEVALQRAQEARPRRVEVSS